MKKPLYYYVLLGLTLIVFSKQSMAREPLNFQKRPDTINPVQSKIDTSKGVFLFSLQDCLNYAYKNQISLKNASLDTKIAKETINETIGRGIPNISLNSSIVDNLILSKSLLPGEFFGKPGTYVPVTFGVKWQASYTAQATQLIFDASYLVGLRASHVVNELSMKSFKSSKIQTTSNVTKAYYNILAAEERIKSADNTLSRIKKDLGDITELNKNGFKEKIDAQRVEVQYNIAETDREQSLNGLVIALYLLKFQIGMPLENTLGIKGNVSEVKLEPMIDSTSFSYENHILYSLNESLLEADKLKWKNSKASLLPRLSAFANYGTNWYNTSFNHIFDRGFAGSMVGLNFTWNIFDGSQTIHRINESRFTYEKTKNNLEDTKNALILQVKTSRSNYNFYVAAIKNQQRIKNLAQQVYNTVKIKYTEGIGSSLELNDAEIALKDAENLYINALLNALVSKVDLDQAMGTIKP